VASAGTVVLLHGFPESGESWAAQVDALEAAGFRAVAPDQRGYDRDRRPEGRRAYRVEALVDDVVAMIDATGEGRVHLVGHDWGGGVAWAVAARHPERLRSLTVVSTPHPGAFRRSLLGTQLLRSWYLLFFQLPWIPERALLARDGASMQWTLERSGLPREIAARYVERMREPGALTAALNWYRALPLSRPSAAIGRIRVPTLFVWSTGDTALGRAAAERTAAWVDAPYRFEVLEDVSHWIPETAPDVLNRLLVEHLSTY
jgi:pimeloyl-ACP methyl ester carboxylesterase